MKHRQLILQALKSVLGDDHIRAEMAFSNYTFKQMDEPYGQSDDTPRKILAGYQGRAKRILDAISYVEGQDDN